MERTSPVCKSSIASRRFLAAVLGALVGALVAGPLLAQGQQTLEETLERLKAELADQQAKEGGEPARGTPEDPFTDTLEVRLVEVEAVVTGKGGERIEGLDRSAFRLLVDGEEVAIEAFEEIRPVAASAPATASGEAPGVAGGTARAEPAAPAGPARDVLVFVDDYFTDRGTRKRLLGNLGENLDSLGPQDRMAVVRFAGWGLEVRSEWTSSKEDLAEVLEELRGETPGDVVRRAEMASMQDPILGLDDEKLADRRLIQQISDVAIAMGVAMRAFSEGSARKLFVPITQGWNFDQLRDFSTPTDLATAELARVAGSLAAAAPPLQYSNATGVGLPPGRGELSRRAEQDDLYGDSVLSPVVDTANLLGYSVYPMLLGRSTQDEVLRTGLWLVARETGGRIATEGAAARLPLQPVVEDTGSYYVLAFSPDRSFDDRRHTVEVVVEEPPGAKVRHRRSFTDLSPRTREIMELERQVLLEGSGGDLEIQLGQAKPGRGSTVEVPVTIRIPMDWVTMVPQDEEGLFAADLELRVAAVDPQGRRSDTTSVPVELAGPEPEPGSHALYETAVQIRESKEGVPQRLVLYLYDRVTGASKMAAVELEL